MKTIATQQTQGLTTKKEPKALTFEEALKTIREIQAKYEKIEKEQPSQQETHPHVCIL